ncbi:MAG: HD domain-containing protein [Actinomycetota bacterium]|nr:HD domain-containing protein [Actinomycetota bacterium]MCL6092574.1 HD domain-containing protein [Actinomycetota bacterium]MDA8166866.1 HD domain-containing protein [Actinomycetota bacterium]
MSIRKKTIIIVGIAFVCLTLAAYLALPSILMSRFGDTESADVRDSTQRAVETLNDQAATLNDFARDWASWNDTYAFIADGNSTYIRSNLQPDTSFRNLQVSLMLFINAQHQVIFAKGYDLGAEHDLIIPDGLKSTLAGDSLLTGHTSPGQSMHGVMSLPQGLMLIAAQPILTSDGTGPVRGTLLWGRSLDAYETGKLSEATHLSLTIEPVRTPGLPSDMRAALASVSASNPIAVRPLDEDTIAGYALINDIHGKPAALLRETQPRTIYAQSRTVIRYLTAAIAAGGLFAGIGTVLLLEKWVLSRTTRLSGDISGIAASGDAAARISMDGSDELSYLAGNINEMLASLEASQRQLRTAHNDLGLSIRERSRERRQKAAVLESLTEIDRELIDAGGSQPLILQRICRRATELLHAPMGLIAMGDAGSIQVTTSIGIDDPEEAGRWLTGLLEDVEVIDAADAATGLLSEQLCGRLESMMAPEPDRFLTARGITSLVCSPLATGEQAQGALIVFDKEPRVWQRDEIQVLDLLAAQVSLAMDEAQLFRQEHLRREELAALYELSQALANAPPDVEAILDIVVRHAAEKIHVTFACIALADAAQRYTVRTCHPLRTIEGDLNLCNVCESSPGICLEIIEDGEPRVIDRSMPGFEDILQKSDFSHIARSLCLAPIRTSERNFGLLILAEARSGEREPFTTEKLRLARSIGDQTSSALNRAELFEKLQRSYLETVLSLATAVEAKDAYTAGHAEKLSAIAVAVGRELGLEDEELDSLHRGAILHDVGKIGVDDSILQKRGSLTDEEWERMRRHPDIGAQILKPVPQLKNAALIVRHHHERFDGHGYPSGLAGEEIPVGARILAVADAFSAMVDQRVYKEPVSRRAALEELITCAGSQFDPRVVEAFIRLLERGEIAG